MKKLMLLCLCVLTTACASVDRSELNQKLALQIQEKLDAASVCCKNFSEMNYEEVEFSLPIRVKLNDKSSVFIFEDNKKSYFSAYRLPSHSTDYLLLVESLFRRANSYHANPGWLYVVPKLVLLDDAFNVQQLIELPVQLNARRGYSMDALLKLTSKYKYMVVYAAKGYNESVGELGARPQLKTIYTGGGVPTIYTDPGSKSNIGTTPKGSIRLTFIDPLAKPEEISVD